MYKTIDALIIQAIREKRPGAPLYEAGVCKEAGKIERDTGRDAFRIIDGRLQALRKAGKIRHLTKCEAKATSGRLQPGWNVVA